MKHPTGILLAAVSFAALSVCAQPAARAAAAGAGSLSSMTFMLGTWSCSGKALDGSTFQTTQITTFSKDGAKLVTRDSEGKGTTTVWWDAPKKHWVQTAETGKGSGFQTSPGWSGNALVFLGTLQLAGAPEVGFRSTTTKVSDTKLQVLDELAVSGSWLETDSATCAKAR